MRSKVHFSQMLILYIGAVSGPNGGVVKLQDAIKKPWPDVAAIPEMPSASASASAGAGTEV